MTSHDKKVSSSYFTCLILIIIMWKSKQKMFILIIMRAKVRHQDVLIIYIYFMHVYWFYSNVDEDNIVRWSTTEFNYI